MATMRRRSFLGILGGAAAWPLATRAQQTALPVVGILGGASAAPNAAPLASFREGLRDAGYIEGQNVVIEAQWADGHYDRLPVLAAELVHRPAAIIVASNLPSVFAAKAATSTIPIVFISSGDPVQLGIVASLNRPGGNITGVNFFAVEVASKTTGVADRGSAYSHGDRPADKPEQPKDRRRNRTVTGGRPHRWKTDSRSGGRQRTRL